MSELTSDDVPVDTTSGNEDVSVVTRFMVTPPLPPGSPPPNAQYHNSIRLPTFKSVSKQARESNSICKNFKKSNCQREDCKYSHIIFCLDYVNRSSCNFLKCRFIHCTKEEEMHYKNTGIPPVCLNTPCQVLGCQLRHISPHSTETSSTDPSAINNYSSVAKSTVPISDIPSAMDPKFLEKIQLRPPPTNVSLSIKNYNQNITCQHKGKRGIDSRQTEYCNPESDDISYEDLPIKRAKCVIDNNIQTCIVSNCSNCERSSQTYINALERLDNAIEIKKELEKEKIELECELNSNLSRIMKMMEKKIQVNTRPVPTSNQLNTTLRMMIDDTQPGVSRSTIVGYSNQPSNSSSIPPISTSKSFVTFENITRDDVNYPSLQHFVADQPMLTRVTAQDQNLSTFIGQQMPVQTPYNTQICG